jgi:hypothetical protein
VLKRKRRVKKGKKHATNVNRRSWTTNARKRRKDKKKEEAETSTKEESNKKKEVLIRPGSASKYTNKSYVLLRKKIWGR